MSEVLESNDACWSAMSLLHPACAGVVISPGTAKSLRFISFAQPAVLSAPERSRACATTTE